MKKVITLLLISILFSSCGVSIETVVNSSVIKAPYQNPLIVIPFEKFAYGRTGTENLQYVEEKMELKFQADERIEILTFEKAKQEKLSLNENDDIEQKINNSIVNDNKDLLLNIKPTHLGYYNGGLQSATYELVGIDTKTKKEIWKAKFNSSSAFGPALFAEKSAKIIYEKLKEDKVL